MASNSFSEELVNNPTPRIPVCICLDTSGSMACIENGTTRIAELEKGVKLFHDAIRNDETALYAADVCIVVFDDTARKLVDFSTLDLQENIPKFSANGITVMGEGVNLALDLLEKRKQEYKNAGVDYYQPWLVLMTDGQPCGGSEEELKRAQKRTTDFVNAKKLTIFPIGIGNEADKSALEKFSPKFEPLKLKGLKFEEFFSWLSKSVSKVSQSIPGEAVSLDKEGIKDWADVKGWDEAL